MPTQKAILYIINTYICYVTLHLRDDAHSAAFLC